MMEIILTLFDKVLNFITRGRWLEATGDQDCGWIELKDYKL